MNKFFSSLSFFLLPYNLNLFLARSNEEEKNNTAIHQTGHALISYILNKSNSSYYNFDFVTITPRGRSLGFSHEKNPIKSLISEISKELIEKETLYKKDFEKIIDKYEKDFNINL